MRRKGSQTETDWKAALASQPVSGRGQRQQPRSPSERLEPARVVASAARNGRSRGGASSGSQRGRAAFGLINGALSVLVVLMLVAGGLGYAGKFAFEAAGPLNHSTVVVVPPQTNARGIADRLEQDGVIADRHVLVAGYYWERAKAWLAGGKLPNLRAGEYEIPKNASMRQVLDALLEGKAILQKVTIPEGLTSYQIVQILNKQTELSGEIKEIPPEGSLLPETYKFSHGASRSEIIARMQADERKFVGKLWESRAAQLPFKSINEAIIMASIVEKEARNERDRVAGVFLNRLAKHMRLQSDPTIIYVLTAGKGNLGRGITKSEIEAKNEYNTYQIEGMPPTPICNPGRSAIEAVLNPATTDDLFFVADGTGNHAFANNIRDHQNNVIRWRQIEREAKAKAAAVEAASAAVQDQTAGPGVALDVPGVSTSDGGTEASADQAPEAAPPDPTEAAPDPAAAPADVAVVKDKKPKTKTP